MKTTSRLIARLSILASSAFLLCSPFTARAADHGDSPSSANNQTADLADAYLFLDPNDNHRAVLGVTFRGFIVPGEAVNFGAFDPDVHFQVQIENTGDARPDRLITVSFSPRTGASDPQTATVTLPNGRRFHAPTTVSTLAAAPPPPTLSLDQPSGTLFFAGEIDDPFFFDIPGFARFVASIRAGSPNPALLQRGRDTFAGYNVMSFVMSLPATMLQGSSAEVGVSVAALRLIKSGGSTGKGKGRGNRRFEQIDREGNPAINVVAVPFPRKDAYNDATPQDDARGEFAPDIIGTLRSLGTDDASIGILASIAVARGDYLRMRLNVANNGPGGGTNPEAAFPNGRRPGDDVVDTLLFLVANRNPLSDNANANDVPFRSEFPFFAPPQQPRDAGVIDDNTRN